MGKYSARMAKAEKQRKEFLDKYAPEKLKALDENKILETMFSNDKNLPNMCQALLSKETSEFVCVSNGSLHHWKLFYNSGKGKGPKGWTTGASSKSQIISVVEARKIAKKIRAEMLCVADYINTNKDSIDYREIGELFKRNQYVKIETIRYLKYFAIVYPEVFPIFYSKEWQEAVIKNYLKEKDVSNDMAIRLGQIAEDIKKKEKNPLEYAFEVFDLAKEKKWNFGKKSTRGEQDEEQKTTNHKTQAEESTTQSQPAGQPTTEKVCTKAHNRIIFGAPGTGKSHKLRADCEVTFKENFERVTFHPDYYYSNFVGSYKPVMRVDGTSNKKVIQYEFVPGPFLRVYAKAKKIPTKNFLLIIEEINRANVAAVFGDIFQLLDRDENGDSEYKIAASEDVKDWLEKQGVEETELSIPSNMYIWATMNSADQGVFPIDTAFKRRWSFEYIGLNECEDKVKEDWNKFRKKINEVLTEKLNVNEDKCMGPFFLKKEEIEKWGTDDFKPIFASKVLMYLFEDAAKHKRNELFNGKTFSAIYNRYKNGEKIFGDMYDNLNDLLGLPEKNENREDGELNESES